MITSRVTQLATSVRNTVGSWERVDVEPWDEEAAKPFTLTDLAPDAQDIGGPVGQAVLLELLDADGDVVASTETVSR